MAENDDLFTVALSGMMVTQISAPTPVSSNDDVLDYSVASDQSRILLRANRGGRVGLYYINPAQLQTEVKVNHNLGLTEVIQETTVGLPTNAGGSVLTGHVAYTVQSLHDLHHVARGCVRDTLAACGCFVGRQDSGLPAR